MANGIRTSEPRGFNKGRSSKFRESSQIRQTPEKGRRTYRLKRSGNNNKDVDISPKTIHDKKQTALTRIWTQFIVSISYNGTIYQPLRSGRIWHKVNF